MQYLLLIYAAEEYVESLDEGERQRYFRAFIDFTDSLERSGSLLSAHALAPTATATSVRAGEAGPLVTDGPFAETREQLGGVFLVDVKDLDAAIAIARSVPSVERTVVEVRPLLDCQAIAAGAAGPP